MHGDTHKWNRAGVQWSSSPMLTTTPFFVPVQDSSIIDFYPTNFRVDLNGKKFAWQGVALLPFVDEERLLRALQEVYDDLMPDESERLRLMGVAQGGCISWAWHSISWAWHSEVAFHGRGTAFHGRGTVRLHFMGVAQ